MICALSNCDAANCIADSGNKPALGPSTASVRVTDRLTTFVNAVSLEGLACTVAASAAASAAIIVV